MMLVRNGEASLSSGRDPELLRTEAEIARTRQAIASSLAALQRELSQRFDWHTWVRARPILAVVTAFGIGALLGRRGGGLGARHP